MAVAFFVAGALFGAAQFLLAKKMLDVKGRPARSAYYIAQLLILSLALLVVAFLVSDTALLAVAIGIVLSSTALAVANSLKR